MTRWLTYMFCMVVAGCGDENSLGNTHSSFTDSWVSGDISQGSASTSTPGSAGDAYDADPEEEITHDAFFYGEANVTPGDSFQGTSEYWVIYYPEGQEEQILCEASWTVSALESVPACDGCTFAFLVRYTGISITTDVTSSCEAGGFTIADYENEEFIFGYRANEILEKIEGEWRVVGEASYSVERSEFEYNIEGSY